MPIVLKSGNLILLETSGPVQACNGIALPLPLHTVYTVCAINLFKKIGDRGIAVRLLAGADYSLIHNVQNRFVGHTVPWVTGIMRPECQADRQVTSINVG